MTSVCVLATLLVSLGCASQKEVVAPTSIAPIAYADTAPHVLVITGGRIMPMNNDHVLTGWTIVVRGGRITEMAPDGTVEIPGNATRISAGGRYVLPGLVDMHVHINAGDLRAYAQAGITTVRNMWAVPVLNAMHRDSGGGFVSDSVVSPTIYSTSPGIDGTPPYWPRTTVLTDPTKADSLIAQFQHDGWHYIKLYTMLRLDVYDALIESIKARGLIPVGHVPLSVTIEHALSQGQYSIEHLTGYDRAVSGGIRGAVAWASADPSTMTSLAMRTRQAGVWNCPTNVVLDAIAMKSGDDVRRRVAAGRHAMVRALHDAGAMLLAGTDAGIGLTTPGVSLHDELTELVASGLTPYEVLRAATADAARFFGDSGQFGTIAIGARADLLIVDGNPLADLNRLRHPYAVIIRGHPPIEASGP
jgi:imidazolonepropionase-like amidohydrolase